MGGVNMTGEEAYEKYKESYRKLLAAELKFAHAVINAHKVREKTVIGGPDWDMFTDELIAKCEMNLAADEYSQMSDYLNKIGFVP